MLTIVVPGRSEYWDEAKLEFVYANEKDVTLRLEHSLISISKWESKWCVPFLSSEKTPEQILDYIKCMTLNPVDDSVYDRLTRKNIQDINDYIAAPMTATVVNDPTSKRRNSTEFVTSELIYYWMIAYNIPVEFEKWHINRLIMLIRVCSAKNEPAKKMSKSEVAASYRALNAARKAKLHTKG